MKDLLLLGTHAELSSGLAKKVLAVASCACIHIPTKVMPDAEPHSTLDTSSLDTANLPPKGLVLCVGDDLRITMVNSMVRLLASMAPASGLRGSTKLEEAQVEGWLSFLWHFVELPLHVLVAADGSQEASCHIHSQLRGALDKIESHLKRQDWGYLVGQSTTIADVGLAVALKHNSHMLKEVLGPDSCLGTWVENILEECHLSAME